jgi:hypothetical protein
MGRWLSLATGYLCYSALTTGIFKVVLVNLKQAIDRQLP